MAGQIWIFSAESLKNRGSKEAKKSRKEMEEEEFYEGGSPMGE